MPELNVNQFSGMGMEAVAMNTDQYIGTGEDFGLPDKLAYLANYSDLFVAVIGKRGFGQNEIIASIQISLSGANPIAILGAEMNKTGDVLASLNACFSLQNISDKRAPNVAALREFSQGLLAEGRRPIVIVKDFDRLKSAVANSILSIAQKCGLGLILFAGTSFLSQSVFRRFEDSIYVYNLKKMNGRELKSYLRRRNGEDLHISNSQLDAILQQSEGVPDVIDDLVDELIESPKNKLGLPIMHMSVVVVLALVALVFYGTSQDSIGVIVGQVTDNIERLNLAEKIRQGEVDEADLLAEVVIDKRLDQKVIASDPRMITTPVAITKDDQPVVTEPASAVASTKVTPREVRPAVLISVPSVQVPEALTPVLESVSTETLDGGFPEGSWISTAKPSDYTLQIMGSSNEVRIKDFIAAQTSSESFSYFETVYRNQSWFVLTVGQYPNRNAALLAISKLPPNLQVQNPWARNVASIRSALR